MRLSLYIARRFALAVLAVLAGFFTLMFLIDMVEQIRRLSGVGAGLGDAALLSLLNVPGSVYRILPLIVILASVALFLTMARSSELVVIRAAGRSALRMLVSPVTTAILAGLVAVAVLNPLVAATTKRYQTLSDGLRHGGGNVLSISPEGLWLRQSGGDGDGAQTVIHAARANQDGTVLSEATFLSFGAEGGPTRRIAARTATLSPGAWRLTDAKSWTLAPGANVEQGAERMADLNVPTDLTVERIRDSFADPAAIGIWDLPDFIAGLERAGFSARKHRVWLQMELATPLLLAAMVLVGAGFTMRHARAGGTGLMVLLAMGAGLAIFFLRNFAQVLGENGQIPVAMAAWIPPVAATLLALGLLLHLEDG